MSSPIDEMIEALDIEVEAIKKSSGSTSVELRGGSKHGSAASDTIYVFPLTEELNLRDDSPVKIYVSGQEIDGTIVSVGNGILTLALSENLGPEIPFARLVVNDSFLMERLRDKLIEIGNGETAFQHSSANAVLNNGPATIGESELPEAVLSLGKLLNADQQLAVRRSIGSNLVFVWGPPGTGKTSTLAAVVHALYLSGKSILLVSNTNIAVDTALERIGDRLNSLPDFHSAAVLRFGPIVSDTLRAKYESQVNLDKVVERHSASLVTEKNTLKEDAARLLTQKAKAQRIIDAYRSLHDAEQRYEQLVQQYEQLKRESAKFSQSSKQLEASIAQSQSDLTRAKSMGTVRKFLSGINEEKLRHTIATGNVQIMSLQNAASACEQRIQECAKNGAHVQKEIDSGKNQLHAVTPEPECKQRLAKINARLSEHEARIKAIDDELASIRQQLVSKCRVLATTVYQTYLKSELSRSFDVVIVDEASMLALPMVFYSAGKATDRVIVAGDFRQLPPIVISDDQRCGEWLKTDVFHHAGIAKAVAAGREPPTLVTLREQFRMQDDICGLLNRIFYDNQLKTAPMVRDRVSRRPFPSQQGLLFVDTSSWQPWASCRLGSFSRYNVLHALLIRNIVRRLASEGYLGAVGEVTERLGVVSPFSAQCRLLAQLIGEVLNTRGSLYAATVHRFQGVSVRRTHT